MKTLKRETLKGKKNYTMHRIREMAAILITLFFFLLLFLFPAAIAGCSADLFLERASLDSGSECSLPKPLLVYNIIGSC